MGDISYEKTDFILPMMMVLKFIVPFLAVATRRHFTISGGIWGCSKWP